MLLHQTAEECPGSYTSALKIYGNYVNIGDFKNLFRDKVSSRPLELTIEVNSFEIGERLKNCKRDYINNIKRTVSTIRFTKDDVQEDEETDNRDDFQSFINLFINTLRKYTTDENHLMSFFQFRLGMNLDFSDDKCIDEIMRSYDLRSRLSELASPKYKVMFQFVEEDKHLKISKVSIIIGDTFRLFEIENKTDKNKKLYSVLPLQYQDYEHLLKEVNFNNTIFDLFSNDNDETEVESTIVSSFILSTIRSILNDLKRNFQGEKINYCSPLRAHPKRYYMLDKAKMTISLDTLDGDAIAEVMKENVQVKNKVNDWFAKFGFNIDVQEFKEVIHHMNVTQNGLTLDITDVGFGISQVLPIIIQGFLSGEDSITIIEQPEIHLHPKMQADLGDLFIDIVNSEEKKLVVETHSEYLLRRIRRRISEGVIKSSDVAICLFHAREKDRSAWVEILEIGEKGDFKWPEEFYGGELYNDTLEFLKNQ